MTSIFFGQCMIKQAIIRLDFCDVPNNQGHSKGHVTRSNFYRNLFVARKNSHVTPHFATAIVALRVARKVERTLSNLLRNFVRMGQSEHIFHLREILRCAHHLVCYCMRCKLRKMLQTCDTPSAT